MNYQGNAVELLKTSGVLTLVRFERDEEHKSFWVKNSDLKTPTARRSSNRSSKTEAVMAVMSDGEFRTLSAISKLSNYESLTGLSAAIRSFRKEENGSHEVLKRLREDGEYEYALGGVRG
jgi:hypothetical protein